MNLQDLTPIQIAIIVAVVVVVIGAIIVFAQRRRTEKLRSRFGPEYERSVAESGDRRRAEALREEREKSARAYFQSHAGEWDRIGLRRRETTGAVGAPAVAAATTMEAARV